MEEDDPEKRIVELERQLTETKWAAREDESRARIQPTRAQRAQTLTVTKPDYSYLIVEGRAGGAGCVR